MVKNYLISVRWEQLQARILPSPADPFFPTDLISVADSSTTYLLLNDARATTLLVGLQPWGVRPYLRRTECACVSGLHFSTASGEISQGLLPCSFATSCLRFAQHYPPWLVKWFCDFFGTGRHSDAWYTISYGLEDSKTGGTLFWVKPITLHRWSECRSCKYPFRTTWLTGFMTAFSR